MSLAMRRSGLGVWRGRRGLGSLPNGSEETLVSPVESRQQGVELVYRHSASPAASAAPPLLLLHGLFGQKKNWQSWTALLQRQAPRDVYALDMRNHGQSPHASKTDYPSMAKDVELLVESGAVGSGRVGLLGHSMGGKAAAYFALARPDLVSALVLEDIVPRPHDASTSADIPRYMDAMLRVQDKITELGETALVGNPNAALAKARQMANEVLRPVCPDAAVRAFLLTNLVLRAGRIQWCVNLTALRRGYAELMDFPVEPEPEFTGGNEQFGGPTLVVSGAKSHYVRDEDHAVFRAFFPDVRFVEVAGAGHWVHSEKPQVFADIVAEFLNECPQ